ncbi:hypothetical protein PTQ21_02155 [Paenibacillus marchantiae]|uniref:hypothetical protein n=1 Tax=Paenibacillus TaxID=44249 RepID=UPI0022A900B0|nr:MULTISPECIES: hypothetical protein [Paenibacillus]MCZ1264077.1 hypothetical protein [Paenibacillus tundrae]WDQ33154.1 hypothetical protein PTQ21_02155 [Paenibacillus marchantiae]
MGYQVDIDDALDELSNLTELFVNGLGDKSSDQAEAFVGERQVVVDHLIDMTDSHKMNAEQQEKLRSILSYDESIQTHMWSLKNMAQKWLIQRNAARNQRSVYEAKYAADSYLMDKRK